MSLVSKRVFFDKLWPRIWTLSLVEETKIYGRDGSKEAIVKLLAKRSNKLCVIPIEGM